jgi:hypothetical protein
VSGTFVCGWGANVPETVLQWGMWDVRVVQLAGNQFNRVSRQQLISLGLTATAIDHQLRAGGLIGVEEGVFALPPVLAHDDWGRWIGATLTAPESFLSHGSASAAWDFLSWSRRFETITRPGSGGPRRHGRILAFRSQTLEGDCTELRGVPITTVERTLLDLARVVSTRALARGVREAIRLELTTMTALADIVGRHPRRRGTHRLAATLARYSGLPLERARSGAEVVALEILRDAGRPLPRLNYKIAGEEADLSWPTHHLIVEIDGGPFHLDVGADAWKQGRWEAAGWEVRRIPSDDVYERPGRLLALAPP